MQLLQQLLQAQEYSVQFVDPELQQLSQLQEPHNQLVALVVQL